MKLSTAAVSLLTGAVSSLHTASATSMDVESPPLHTNLRDIRGSARGSLSSAVDTQVNGSSFERELQVIVGVQGGGDLCPARPGRRLQVGTPAIIDNGVIKLGIQPGGNLNVPGGTPIPDSGGNLETSVGLRYIFPDGSGESESTSFGCDCEGWGVGADGQSLFFNEAIGSSSALDYTILMSTATPSTYISKVAMASGRLTVTHDFHPSPSTPNLYEVTVTLENTSGATINDVYYRRSMDWDVYPTTYSECSTIQPDPATVAYLVDATNDGFVSSDPYASLSSGAVSGFYQFAPFTDFGPHDHGAMFQFKFDPLPPGATKTFNIYYGAAGNQADAEAALQAVRAEVYSFGKPSDPSTSTCVDDPNVFIFGFGEVGGDPIYPPLCATEYQECTPGIESCCDGLTCTKFHPNGCGKCLKDTCDVCDEGQSRDPFTGECQELEAVVPCVAVIDEWNSNDYSAEWATFRSNYPTRPFCLLVPGSSITSPFPTGFEFDTVNNPDGNDRTIASVVNRDNGAVSNLSDWASICGLDTLTSSNSPVIGLFVDNSGSMTTPVVQASYDKFLADMAAKGITISTVTNGVERWVDPFLTTLVPP